MRGQALGVPLSGSDFILAALFHYLDRRTRLCSNVGDRSSLGMMVQ